MEEKKDTSNVTEKTETRKTETKRTDSPRKKTYRSRSGGSGRRSYRSRSSRKFYFRKKVCFFCKNKSAEIDYKDVGLMKRFIAESFKISPRRFTGTCAKHQRKLVKEIKKARQMALIPYLEK